LYHAIIADQEDDEGNACPEIRFLLPVFSWLCPHHFFNSSYSNVTQTVAKILHLLDLRGISPTICMHMLPAISTPNTWSSWLNEAMTVARRGPEFLCVSSVPLPITSPLPRLRIVFSCHSSRRLEAIVLHVGE
jgi:hypothetical protein